LDAADRLGQLKMAEDASIDFYSFLRSSYYQVRRAGLRGSTRPPPAAEAPAPHPLPRPGRRPSPALPAPPAVRPRRAAAPALAAAPQLVPFDPVPDQQARQTQGQLAHAL